MSEKRKVFFDYDGLPTAVQFFGSNKRHLECNDGDDMVTACGLRYTSVDVLTATEVGCLGRIQLCRRCLYSKAFKSLTPKSIGWEP